MHIQDLTRYLTELNDNNNRAGFVMNKPRYDILREEFLALVTALIVQISKVDPLILGCNPKKALFRINRDVRFAKDKRPYKTTFSAAIVANDLKKPSLGGGPAYYFQLNAAGELLFAVGEFMPPKGRLKELRNAVAQDGAGLVKILKNKKLAQTFSKLEDQDKLQRPPKGFDPEHPHIEFIKLKSFMIWDKVDTGKFDPATRPDDVLATLVSSFKTAYPFVGWLRSATALPL